MPLGSWPTVTDDTGTKQDGTVFNKALTDAIRASIQASIFSLTNPSVSAASIIDEVIAARGSLGTLDARLDVTLNEDGTPKANASYVAASTYQVALGSRNVASNGDFVDWSLGGALAPDGWTLAGAGGTIAQCGPALGDTFTFGAGKYCAKITRVAVDVTLSQDIVAAADIADYAEMKGRKVAVAAKVKASAGNLARVRLDDGFTAAVGSSYHTGSGSVEHLTEVLSISSSATKLTAICDVKNSAAAAYFGGIAVVFSDLAPTDWMPISTVLPATTTRQGTVSITAQTFAGVKSVAIGTGTLTSRLSGRIMFNVTTVGNVGASGPDDLMTYTVPANSMIADGQSLRFHMAGAGANNANNKAISYTFDGTTVLATGNFTTEWVDGWGGYCVITREDATHARVEAFFHYGTAGVASGARNGYTRVVVADWTTDRVFKVRTTVSTADNDITQNLMIGESIG